MMRFVKEPLLHFLLLGAVIFAVYEGVSPSGLGAVTGPDAIVVSQARIEGLTDKFTRTWHRSPNETELNGLIQDFIREEVAVREAAALGIDRDDSVIRRLLRQRLEFVTEDVALAEPSEAALRDYLRDHANDFRTEPRISFSQIFFDPQRRGDTLAADTAQLRDRLNAGGDRVPEIATSELVELGDTTLLEHQFTALPLSMAAQLFGEPFAEALHTLKPGQWSAPVASAYGVHLVYVSDIVPGTVPALEQVREAVRRDWVYARRAEVLDAFYAALLQRYRVTIDMPPSQHQAQHQVKTGSDQLAELH